MKLSENTLTRKNEDQKFDELRFEFVFYINDHIICQRFFHVRDYNENFKNSYELKELMDEIIGNDVDGNGMGRLGVIPNYLQKKTLEYMWDAYNPYYVQTEENKNTSDKVDNFQFELKIDKEIVAKGEFSGNKFPPRVRYDVNIKEIIPTIMSEIRTYLSLKNYNKVRV